MRKEIRQRIGSHKNVNTGKLWIEGGGGGVNYVKNKVKLGRFEQRHFVGKLVDKRPSLERRKVRILLVYFSGSGIHLNLHLCCFRAGYGYQTARIS